MTPFKDQAVADTFNQYPETYRMPLLTIRQLIFDTAKELPVVGTVSESLKWQQPSYATSKKAGSPFRLGVVDEQLAVFFHCQTTLVETFRGLFGETLTFSGNRAILLDPTDPLPINALTLCIERALTYHLDQKDKGGASD